MGQTPPSYRALQYAPVVIVVKEVFAQLTVGFSLLDLSPSCGSLVVALLTHYKRGAPFRSRL